MLKSLDQKLAAIHADPSGAKEFILADAKDADMAFGMGAPGMSPEAHGGEVRHRTLAEYREQIRQVARQGLVDIMLMSASTNHQLTIEERLFDGSPVTPAARANDTTDIFLARGGSYPSEPSRPFRTAALDHIQCGHVDCTPEERTRGANLGLYSITFNNRLDEDLAALEAYRAFRLEAERKGFRHFLEVFDPNVDSGLAPDKLPGFINDHIARTLAGVTTAGRPVFLKIVYHGPQAMEELVSYDPHLVVGILGGGAGTTYDAFKLLAEAKKYGARAALFGRKINSAENQLAFVEFLRLIADGQIEPEEAVRAYHAVLKALGIHPRRSLADDLTLQTNVMSYSSAAAVAVGEGLGVREQASGVRGQGSGKRESTRVSGVVDQCGAITSTTIAPSKGKAADCGCGCGGNKASQCKTKPAATEDETAAFDQHPNFAAMTQAEKLAWNRAKRDRLFGEFS